jgi:hypothetical protein
MPLAEPRTNSFPSVDTEIDVGCAFVNDISFETRDDVKVVNEGI